MYSLKYIHKRSDILIKLILNEYLDKHNITRYELAKRTDVHYNIINKYYKNQVVRYDSYIIDKICTALDCEITDVIEYKK